MHPIIKTYSFEHRPDAQSVIERLLILMINWSLDFRPLTLIMQFVCSLVSSGREGNSIRPI